MDLENRLKSRNTDSDEVIEKRLTNAKTEIKYFRKYDYFIINDDLEEASKSLVAIANIARVKAKLFNDEEIIAKWLAK